MISSLSGGRTRGYTGRTPRRFVEFQFKYMDAES
jgi:hypothetical protein